jgi:lipopolysaccharide/colanic/teichoic acid biosynthesis glycosyltransferase
MDTRLHHRYGEKRFANAGASQHSHEALPLWKRALDIACLILAMPALVPIMALIALGIRLSSRGPVLFRQERIGLNARPFICFKFRTMKATAETRSHEAYLEKLMHSAVPMKKLDNSGDARILGIGVLLRASGLDELPQVFNILRGEMSLVGPRPCIRYEYEKFKPEHRARFNAVPGLTGLWQVNGKNHTTFQEMIDFDIQYSRQLSFRNDVAILLRTFPVLVGQVTEALQHKRAQRHARGPVSQPRAAANATREMTTV